MNFSDGIYTLSSYLFKHCFLVYSPLYSTYKCLSDRKILSLLKQTVIPGIIVVDVGANIGFYYKILSELVGPTGEVYSFEPDSDNFKYLEKKLSKKPDFIKIDEQGFDYSALSGARQLIKNSINLKILGELYPYGLRRAGSSSQEYINFLLENSMKVDFFSAINLDSDDRYKYTDFLASSMGQV